MKTLFVMVRRASDGSLVDQGTGDFVGPQPNRLAAELYRRELSQRFPEPEFYMETLDDAILANELAYEAKVEQERQAAAQKKNLPPEVVAVRRLVELYQRYGLEEILSEKQLENLAVDSLTALSPEYGPPPTA